MKKNVLVSTATGLMACAAMSVVPTMAAPKAPTTVTYSNNYKYQSHGNYALSPDGKTVVNPQTGKLVKYNGIFFRNESTKQLDGSIKTVTTRYVVKNGKVQSFSQKTSSTKPTTPKKTPTKPTPQKPSFKPDKKPDRKPNKKPTSPQKTPDYGSIRQKDYWDNGTGKHNYRVVEEYQGQGYGFGDKTHNESYGTSTPTGKGYVIDSNSKSGRKVNYNGILFHYTDREAENGAKARKSDRYVVNRGDVQSKSSQVTGEQELFQDPVVIPSQNLSND